MDIDEVLDGKLLNRFVLIGNPVGHSLSPVMHNKLYEHMAKSCPHFGTWRYSAVLCEDERSALEQIDKVRLGIYKGMNITIVTSATTDKEGKFLLDQLGMPFRK